jgi:Uma2 family endonuclease
MRAMTRLDAIDMPHAARLTARDFRLLAANGAFEEYARAELIEGEIFVVNAQFRRHAAVRRKLMRRFETALDPRSDGVGAVDECNVAFGDRTMPQPDITLTTEPEGDGPVPMASVRLLVEIADSTAEHDLGPKHDLYARFAVPEYWVFDIKARLVHQFWSPGPEGYAERRESRLGERLEATTITELAIETQGLA